MSLHRILQNHQLKEEAHHILHGERKRDAFLSFVCARTRTRAKQREGGRALGVRAQNTLYLGCKV